MNEQSKTAVSAEVKDDITALRDYIEISYRTQVAIENGDYKDRTELGDIILFDYLVKARETVGKIYVAVNEGVS